MSVDELVLSVSQYKTQLEQIDFALQSANNDSRLQLQELQLNLLQLLELTLQQLQHKQAEENQKKSINKTIIKKTDNDDNDDTQTLDQEFALFKAEIAALDGESKPNIIENDRESLQSSNTDESSELSSRSSSNSSDNEEVDDDDDDDDDNASLSEGEKKAMEEWEGTQVRAPYTEKWGGHTYHNAVVLNYVSPEMQDEPTTSEKPQPQVRVLFSQPTSLAMLPCRFFLSGRCKFSDDKCRFSHGVLVPISHLQEYKEPDLDSIIGGSRVLAKHEENLWHSGQVEDVLDDRSAFSVMCEPCKTVYEVSLSSMIPLRASSETDEGHTEYQKCDSIVMESDNEDEAETAVFVPNSAWFVNTMTQKLGDWEKHTKGIGSQLMAKMGYIVGTGLGPEGTGRVEPVSAYVYPQGVSLDRCMELREASGGEDLLQVEKRLKREQKKHLERQKRNEDRIHTNTSIFQIINNKLGGKGDGSLLDHEDAGGGSDAAKQKMNVSRKSLQKDSVKDLNRKNLQLGSRINQIEKEISKLKESKSRQASNVNAAQSIDTRLQGKLQELKSIKDAERKVHGEQQNRRHTKKLCVF